MAQSLGSLYVELSANTAKFVGPLSDAARAAKSAASDISKEFSSLQRVASQTFGAFGSFNPIISELSFALSEMGHRAADAMGSFGKISTAIGAIGSIGAGATTALGSLAIGTLGLAAHSAEAAAKIDELSDATGISAEALTGLGFAAKQVGVSQESLATGLERMEKSAGAAAIAPVGAINAFTRLGVAVKDAAGNTVPAIPLFTAIAGKLSAVTDQSMKAYLAQQIFGRGWAGLMPLISQGPAVIDNWVAAARRMGLVLTDEQVEAAEHFTQTLGVLSGVVEGLANQLMVQLLPTLQTVATAIEDDLGKGPDTSWIVRMTKQFVAAGADMIAIAKIVNAAVNEIGGSFSAPVERFKKEWNEKGTTLGPMQKPNAIVNLLGSELLGDFSGQKESFTDYYKQVMKEHDDFIAKLSAPPAAVQMAKPRPSVSGLAGAARSLVPVEPQDTVTALVEKLKAQAAAELDLAGAIGLSAAAELAQKAAGEASAKIVETKTELLNKERTLREQLANAQANQQGTEAARIQAEIAGVHKLLDELQANTPLIQKAYLEIDAAQESVKLGGEMFKETQGFDREISSLGELAQAYRSGGAAIAAAGIDKQLEEDKQRVAEQQELLARVKIADPSNVTAIQRESTALSNLTAALERHRVQLDAIRSKTIDKDISDQAFAFSEEAAAVERLNEARLQGAAAIREAEVQAKVSEFENANPGMSPGQIRDITEVYRQQSAEAQRTAVAEVAAQYEVNRSYDDEITKLQQAREVLQGAGQSTLLIDAAIDDAQQKNNASLDQAAEKVGTLSLKYAALLDTIQRQGDNLGEMLFGSLEKSLDSLSDELAKFIVTGKNGFKQWGEQLAESLVNDSIKNSFSNLAGLAQRASGGNLTGSAGKGPTGPLATVTSSFEKVFGLSPKQEGKGPIGDAGHPIYVKFAPGDLASLANAKASGAALGLPDFGSALASGPAAPGAKVFSVLSRAATNRAAAPGARGGLGPLGDLFSKPGTTPPFFPELTPPIFPSDSDSAAALGLPDFGSVLASGPATPNAQPLSKILAVLAGGSGGSGEGGATGVVGLLGKFFGMFGGFLAEGGDVTPGKAYMVGEKHPEFFVPKQAGSVVPTLRTGGGEVHNHHNTININVPPGMNADSFQRSQGQIYADAHAHLAAANARR